MAALCAVWLTLDDTQRHAMGRHVSGHRGPEWRERLPRAFRPGDELQRPNNLTRIDRAFFERLQMLTEESVKERTGPYLTGDEIDAVLKRQDAIVDHLTQLIETKGENRVLFGDSTLTTQ